MEGAPANRSTHSSPSRGILTAEASRVARVETCGPSQHVLMNDVTHILSAIEQGDPRAAEELLPLVYSELRRLAAQKMAHEQPGQTLEATALVHEAYLRLVGTSSPRHWDGRGHFFAAAAEAMRRILVDAARRRRAQKRAGGERIDIEDLLGRDGEGQIDLLALDEALKKLEDLHPDSAQVIKLRFFGNCTLEETAELMGMSRATAERKWAYARAWLFGQLAPK